MGLFVPRDFKAGERISEYDGTIISTHQADALRHRGFHSHIIGLAYGHLALCGLEDWAAAGGRGGRSFVNHTFDPHKRNAKFQKTSGFHPDGQPRWPPEKTASRNSEIQLSTSTPLNASLYRRLDTFTPERKFCLIMARATGAIGTGRYSKYREDRKEASKQGMNEGMKE